MSAQAVTQQGSPDQTSARLVWVLNRDVRPYKAEFRGMEIIVPPNMEKIPKHVREGGNLLEYLEACKFVRDLKQPQEWKMDSNGKPQPMFYSKMLLEQELTEDEYKTIVRKTSVQIKTEMKKEEKKAKEAHKTGVAKVSNKYLADDEE